MVVMSGISKGNYMWPWTGWQQKAKGSYCDMQLRREYEVWGKEDQFNTGAKKPKLLSEGHVKSQ